jgi:LAO/AO transport system kinase
MELADLVVINKADLDADAATRARAQITSALRLFGQHGDPAHAAHDGAHWQPQVLQISALKAQGLQPFWALVTQFRDRQAASGRLAARRLQQNKAWMWERIDAGLRAAFRQHPGVRSALPAVSAQVEAGQLLPSIAARRLLAQMGLRAAPAAARRAASIRAADAHEDTPANTPEDQPDNDHEVTHARHH